MVPHPQGPTRRACSLSFGSENAIPFRVAAQALDIGHMASRA